MKHWEQKDKKTISKFTKQDESSVENFKLNK